MKNGQKVARFSKVANFSKVAKFNFWWPNTLKSGQISKFWPQNGQSGNPDANDHELFLIIGWSPLGGALPLGPVLGTLVMAPTFFWEAGLNVLPFKPVVGNISCWFTTTLFDLYFDLSIMTNNGDFPLGPVNNNSTSRILLQLGIHWVLLPFRSCK